MIIAVVKIAPRGICLPDFQKRMGNWASIFIHDAPRHNDPLTKRCSRMLQGEVIVGFGNLLVDSLQLRDFPLIEATILISASVYIAANFLADIGAILLNPKLRTG